MSTPPAPGASSRRQVLRCAAAAGLASALPGLVRAADDLDEEGAYRLAREAYLYAYPLAYFARLRHTRFTEPDPVLGRPARWNRFDHQSAVVTPATVGAPQTDTFYSRLWTDVTREPLLVRVPKTDGRYWSLQCCDFLGTTYGMPNRRNIVGETWIAIVGPGWQGNLPSEVSQTLRHPSNQGYSVLRMYFAGPPDRARALEIQNGFVALPLSVYAAGGGAGWSGVAAEPFRPAAPAQDPLADFRAMQRLWLESPPPAADQAITARYAVLGLGPNAAPIDSLPPAVQKGMARAEAETRALVVQTTRAVPGTRTANGWVLPKPSIGLYDDGDTLYRATCALFGTVCTPVAENVYVVAQHEPGFAKRLNGSARYELFFDKEMLPQAGAFWSVHAYTDRYTLIDHPAARYSVGDRTPGLVYGADGSLTVSLQPEPPEGARQANWISTLKDQPFSLVVRAYEPQGKIKDLSWPGPQIRVVG